MLAAVVALDGMFDSGLTAVLDVLATARAFAVTMPGVDADIRTSTVGVGDPAGGTIRTGLGHVVPTVPLSSLDPVPDVVVLPALGLRTPESIVGTVSRHPLVSVVRQIFERGIAVAGACSGTFFLAEAGTLDGAPATTSWWLAPAFRSRYPEVALDEQRMVVHSDRVTTAGSAFAHVDLALALVAQHDADLAESVGRFLLIGDRPTQGAFAMPSLLARRNPIVAAFERWVRDHLADPLPVADAAVELGISERTLQRATATALNMSPIAFVQHIRIDHAIYLLRASDLSLDAVAGAVGYRNTATLRSLVRRHRGTALGELRGSRFEPSGVTQR